MSDVDRSRVEDGLEQGDQQVWLSLTRIVLSILTFISFSDLISFCLSFEPRSIAPNFESI